MVQRRERRQEFRDGRECVFAGERKSCASNMSAAGRICSCSEVIGVDLCFVLREDRYENHLFISAGLLWSLFSMSVHAAGSRGDLLRLGSPDKT